MSSCALDLWAHSGLNSVDLKLCYDAKYTTDFGFYLSDIWVLVLSRLLNIINQTLASVGVDPTLADVRVQLDISKKPSSGATATTLSSGENYDHAPKRLRTEGSM